MSLCDEAIPVITVWDINTRFTTSARKKMVESLELKYSKNAMNHTKL